MYNMKKIVAFLLILTLLTMANPVFAASKEPAGDRIDLRTGYPITFPANTPFHIKHGWVSLIPNPQNDPIGIYDFELEVDGVWLEEDFVMRLVDFKNPDYPRQIQWVYNFASGMTGTHTFTGHWYGPCRPLIDQGWYSGPCSTPNARVEAITQTLTITFVP